MHAIHIHDLTTEELRRYSRHLLIPEFNIAGQCKLKQSRVLVVGAGGLGCPLLLYLAAAGIGTIGVVDFDSVDLSNLQRQVLYTLEDIGTSKVETVAKKLRALNPHVEVVPHALKISADNALDIIRSYDIVADGTDNFPSRYLINDACVILNKPLVYGSIFQFEGQVSVFNHVDSDGNRGPNYRDLFPDPPPPGMVPSCAEGGVLGVLPGIIGSLQASEVIKVLTGIGDSLSGRLFVFDALSFTSVTLDLAKRDDLPTIEHLIDYDEFCGLTGNDGESWPNVRSISARELADMRSSSAKFQLIDVREAYEYDIVNLEGKLMPLRQIKQKHDEISRSMKVVMYCRTGQRSAKAITMLQNAYQFDNLYNLKGGIRAYAEEIDSSLPVY